MKRHLNRQSLLRTGAIVCAFSLGLTTMCGALPPLPVLFAAVNSEVQTGSPNSHEEKVEFKHSLMRRASRSVLHPSVSGLSQPQSQPAKTYQRSAHAYRDQRSEVDAPLRC